MAHRAETECPVCERGQLRPGTATETYNYKGTAFELDDILFSTCDHCGAELITPTQARENERRIRDKHRQIDGLLTGEQIKAIRKGLGLTQQQAAEVFGGGTNSFTKYERGEVIQSVAMDRLLRLVAELEPAMPELLRIAQKTTREVVERNRTTVCDYGAPCPVVAHPPPKRKNAQILRLCPPKVEIKQEQWLDSEELRAANG